MWTKQQKEIELLAAIKAAADAARLAEAFSLRTFRRLPPGIA
jgi:hypothetical protein